MIDDRIKLNNHNGIDIFVNSHGQFFAEVSGVGLHDATMDRLVLRIEEAMKSEAKAIKLELPCYAYTQDEDTYGVMNLTLVGLNRNDQTLKWKEPCDKQVVFALPATADNLSLLRELANARETAERIEKHIKDRKITPGRYGGRISPSEYGQYMAGLQHKYSEALAASK